MTEDCGHTPEEHDSMHQDLAARLASGDITAIIPALSNNTLNMLLQAASAEMFIRSADWDLAKRNWEQLDGLIRRTLFVDSAEESEFPVEYAMLKQAQKGYQKLIELDQSQAEAQDELNTMFEQHGIAEAKRPEKKDDFPGFYL